MANKKTSVLDSLVTQLGGLSVVATATRILSTPGAARKDAPYVGLIAGSEEMLVEDAVNVRYELDVDLLLLKQGRDIEIMLDTIKNLLFDDTLPATIGALQVRVVGQEEVALVDGDSFSSTRIVLTITYVAVKGAF